MSTHPENTIPAFQEAIHTWMFKHHNSYAETLQKLDAFFEELGLLKADWSFFQSSLLAQKRLTKLSSC